METTKYTKEYFIDKFSKIPEDEIGKEELDEHCVLFHCGVVDNGEGDYLATEEALALANLLKDLVKNNIVVQQNPINAVWIINDNPRGTAKTNILKALNSIE